MSDFEETVIRKLCAIADAVNWGDQQAVEILHRLPPRPLLKALLGIVYNVQSGAITPMSGTDTINLTNAANPAAATRYLGIIDVAGGTALPTLAVTAGTASLVALVPATALSGINQNQFFFGVYPVDTANETNDAVTVTATLPDGSPPVVLNFLISGTGETETLDTNSAVGSWANAPTVPTSPV
jgi:hypothetical protein